MQFLVTGVAGFLGFHLTLSLLKRGDDVVGVDNLTDFYDSQLQHDRLDVIGSNRRGSTFTFLREDIADRDAMVALFADDSFDVMRGSPGALDIELWENEDLPTGLLRISSLSQFVLQTFSGYFFVCRQIPMPRAPLFFPNVMFDI